MDGTSQPLTQPKPRLLDRVRHEIRTRHYSRRTARLADPTAPAPPETLAAFLVRLTGVDITRCPVCHRGRLRRVGVIPPGALELPVLDTS